MDKLKFANAPLRATEVRNIRLSTRQINPKYQVDSGINSTTSDTGRLEVLRIEARQPSLPTFSCRWDLNANTVDIDLIGDAVARRAFEKGKRGYRGHHTTIVSDSPRIYEITIHMPGEHVFTGTIQLEVGFGLLLQDTLTFEAELIQ
jgi:hypothetical protein